jgi:hypothetical protein
MSLSLNNVYAHYIQLAVGKSEFTQRVVDSLDARSIERAKTRWEKDEDEPKILWRTDKDKKRIENLRRFEDLYNRKHEKHLRPIWLPTGKVEYLEVNLFRWVTTLYADLSLGGGATVKSQNSAYDWYLNEDLNIWHYFYNWMVYVSIYGFCPVQIVQNEKGEVDFLELDPSVIYPKWKDGTFYEFEWISKKIQLSPDDVAIPNGLGYDFDPKRMDGIVYEERHFEGRIEYYLYAVSGDEVMMMLPVQFYNPQLPTLRPDPEGSGRMISYVETNIPEFLIVLIPNQIFNQEFISDYTDIEQLVSRINTRMTQIDRVLNIHANPKLILPSSFQQQDPYTGESTGRGLRDEILYIDPEDNHTMPQYLTWDGQLSAAYQQLDAVVDMFCTVAEVSPSLLVRSQSGSTFPESAAAYKMKLTPTLNRINRKSTKFEMGIKKFLYVYGLKLQQCDKLKAVSGDPEYLQALMNAEDTPYTAADAKVEPEEIQQRRIQVRFKPALPQDDRLLIDRLQGQPSVSIRRVLTDVDDMTEEEAVEEERRIMDQEEAMNDDFGNDNLGYSLDGGAQENSEYARPNEIQGNPAPQSADLGNVT